MINSTLCYIERDGKYLMLHRVKKKNDINHDKWIGIGGKFEDKESPYDCVIREAYEETGLTLTEPEYRGIITFAPDNWETEQMHLFTCKKYEGEIKDCDEGTLEWIDKKDVLSLPIWEGDKIFLEIINGPSPFFSLKLEYERDVLVGAILDGKPVL